MYKMDFRKPLNNLGGAARNYLCASGIRAAMDQIEQEILKRAKDGKIDCHTALGIAKKCGVHPKEVGAKLDEMGIKIHNCQLGCFK
jgi:hypothetical protein